MASLKCKMCGGELQVTEDSTVCECIYCGSKQTVPVIDDDKKFKLYDRANKLRFNCEFDKATGVYESIISEFNDEAEAYWGILLCRYGIEYVDDPATGKKVPTCHRSSYDSIMDDDDFEMVMENAPDLIARNVYREQAKEIEEIRKGIIEVSGKEEPYDIFICYKETAEDGQRTIDSVLAQDVYDELVSKNYRVFFARITLEDKLGTEYEPYIFAALNSAKIMLAFGTSYDYYNAVWVKNEWSRFIKLMSKDKSKHLIPCYKNIDAYDIPKEFAKLQAQDLGKVGAIQDLLRGIEKILGNRSAKLEKEEHKEGTTVSSLLKRVDIFLTDGDWENANLYCEKVLDISPENAEAYYGKILATAKVKKKTDLVFLSSSEKKKILESSDYGKVKRFSDAETISTLDGYLNELIEFKITDNCVQKYIGDEENVIIPDGIIEIGDSAFAEKSKIKSILIPNSVRKIGKKAFYGCSSLEEIVISEYVEIIGEMAFSGIGSCRIIKDRYNRNFVMEDGLLYTASRDRILYCDPSKKKNKLVVQNSIKSIDGFAFENSQIEEIILLPNGVEKIGDGAFSNCMILRSIIIPKSVEQIGLEAFRNTKVCIKTYADSYAAEYAKHNNITAEYF